MSKFAKFSEKFSLSEKLPKQGLRDRKAHQRGLLVNTAVVIKCQDTVSG